MKGWYNFYCPPLPFVLNPKTNKYEYVGMDVRFQKTKLDIPIRNGSTESDYKDGVDLESIIGKDELDDIFNRDSRASLFHSYDKLKKSGIKKKKKDKHKKGVKHKKKGKGGDRSNPKVKIKTKSKSSKKAKDSQQSGSFGSFKLKSFGSGEKSNLKRNFGFDRLFDGDLNDDEITEAIFNKFLDDNEINGDNIADEISNLNISEDKKRVIMEKINEKLLTNALLGDHNHKKEGKMSNNILDKVHNFFTNNFDPLEDALYKMSSTKGIPISNELMKVNKKMIDDYLANGGDLRSLRMNENGEIAVDETNNGEIFQYELNNIYQQELKKKNDLNNYYKKNLNIKNYDPMKEISNGRKKSTDIAWNIVRQWKSDRKIDFKVIIYISFFFFYI